MEVRDSTVPLTSEEVIRRVFFTGVTDTFSHEHTTKEHFEFPYV